MTKIRYKRSEIKLLQIVISMFSIFSGNFNSSEPVSWIKYGMKLSLWLVRYVGVSSSGVTYNSGSGSGSGTFTSSRSQSSGRYGGFGNEKDDDDFNVRDRYGDDKSNQGSSFKSQRDSASNIENVSRKGSSRHVRYSDVLVPCGFFHHLLCSKQQIIFSLNYFQIVHILNFLHAL